MKNDDQTLKKSTKKCAWKIKVVLYKKRARVMRQVEGEETYHISSTTIHLPVAANTCLYRWTLELSASSL